MLDRHRMLADHWITF